MAVSLDGIEFSQDLFLPIGNEKIRDENIGILGACAAKIQSICQRIWNWTTCPIRTIWTTARSALGGVIRDLFFFPLKPYLNHEQMKLERRYFSDFWDPQAPLDPNLKDHLVVRENFAVRDEVFKITLNGQRHAITCRMIESKEGVADPSSVSEVARPQENGLFPKWFNFLLIPGNLTTIDNNVIGMYPFLSSYLAIKNEHITLPPARFMMITQYDICRLGDGDAREEYLPESLDQAAMILASTISSLQKKYGQPLDELVAHSIGSVFFSAALKYMTAQSIPRNITFHCGPSSVSTVGKNFWFGRISAKLAEISNWSVDVAKEIAAFYKKFSESKKFSLVISGVKQDHYFSDGANLCSAAEILSLKEKNQIDLLLFDPPVQFFHNRAHHNLPIDFLVTNYLTDTSNLEFMGQDNHFAKALLRHSLPPLLADSSSVCVKEASKNL